MIRYYSSESLNTKIPKVVYNNFDTDKVRILSENRNKQGIYCFTNKINGKIYIGSSINLTTRFYKYYHIDNLMQRNTPIYSALLKHGFSNFSLSILEYIIEENENPIVREQYYLDLLQPDYNVLTTAGSSLGYKHTEETLKYFKERVPSEKTRNNLSLAATGRILSEEIREKISSKHKGKVLSESTKLKISEYATNTRGVKVIIKNIENNEEFVFESLVNAGKHLGVTRTAIAKALKNDTLIKGIYKVIKMGAACCGAS
jgi:group I intron endonuclease